MQTQNQDRIKKVAIKGCGSFETQAFEFNPFLLFVIWEEENCHYLSEEQREFEFSVGDKGQMGSDKVFNNMGR